MVKQEEIIFIGGSGLLGSKIKKLLPKAAYPSHSEFDVTNYHQMKKFVQHNNFKILIHAAAFTSPPRVDKEPIKAIDTNIIGTANIVRLSIYFNLKLIYISTDYVFNGEKGNYIEKDPMHPVNKYAWSKLGGECAVRLYDNSIIIRTSFGPKKFPYEKAFTDQWTSREHVGKIAEKIIRLLDTEFIGVLHIGGERKTVFEYAKSLEGSEHVRGLLTTDMNFPIPKDTSLDCNKYKELIQDTLKKKD